MIACTAPWWVPLAIYAALAVGCAVGVMVAAVLRVAGDSGDEHGELK